AGNGDGGVLLKSQRKDTEFKRRKSFDGLRGRPGEEAWRTCAMDARPRRFGPASLVAVLLLLPAGPAPAESVPVGRLLPLAVRDGRCECVLPTDRPDEKYYLILGSLARTGGPYRITVRTAATTEPSL